VPAAAPAATTPAATAPIACFAVSFFAEPLFAELAARDVAIFEPAREAEEVDPLTLLPDLPAALPFELFGPFASAFEALTDFEAPTDFGFEAVLAF
jgi:hypothetical protein